MPEAQTRLANYFVKPHHTKQPLTRRKGTVLAVSHMGADVELGSSGVTVPNVKWMTHIPVVGECVWVDFVGPDPTITGAASVCTGEQGDYQFPTLLNSFTNLGSGHSVASYWRDSDGWVHLEGVVTRADTGPPITIFTLPVGYRPAHTVYAPQLISSDVNCRIEIQTDGDVVFSLDSTVSTLAYLSLCGISFQADDAHHESQWQPLRILSSYVPSNTFGGYTGMFTRDDGLMIMRGFLSGGAAPSAITAVIGLPDTAMTKKADVFQPSSNNGTNEAAARLDRSVDGHLIFIVGNSTGLILDQVHFWSYKTDMAWSTPTLLNSWVDYGPEYHPAQYLKDKNGMVHLRGLIKSGTITSSAFNLPAGYRPSGKHIFMAESNNTRGRLDVLANGDVIPQAGTNSHFSLAHASFKAVA